MSRSVLAISALALVSSSSLAQTIVRGPLYNPATGARYYAVQAANWGAANTFAASIGCSMATIADAAENSWVVANFSPQLSNAKLFIGLNDSVTEGTLSWTSGTSTYTNWAPGEPANSANSDFAVITTNGQWQLRDATYTPISIIKTTGPLRVPQEYATLAAAFAAMPGAASGHVQLAPGTYAIDTPLATPAGISGLIEPSSPGTVTLLAPTSGPAITFNNNWTLRNIDVHGRGNNPMLALNPNSITDCFNIHLAALPGSTASQIQVAQGSNFRVDSGFIFGGGPVIQGNQGSALLRSTLIDSTTAVTTGTGTLVTILGSTITRCGPGPLFTPGNSNLLRGSIIWGNSGTIDSSQVASQFCDWQTPQFGFQNTSVDPRFVNAAGGDFHLRPGSPCIDTGTIQIVTTWIPSNLAQFVDADLKNRMHNDPSVPDYAEGSPACDRGAFEFQGQSCAGDFNLDGTVDFFDYLDFVDAFSVGC